MKQTRVCLMRHKLPFYVILFAVCAGALFVVQTILAPSASENISLTEKYLDFTQNFNTFFVERIIKQGPTKKSGNNPNPGDGDEKQPDDELPNVSNWLDACIAAHHVMGHAHTPFDPQATITVGDAKAECDGYGFLGLASKIFGSTSDIQTMTQDAFSKVSTFSQVTVGSEADLQQGDVLFFPNSVEIFYAVNNSVMTTIAWSSADVGTELYSSDLTSEHEASACPISVTTSTPFHYSDVQAVFRQTTPSPTPPSPPPPPPSGGSGKMLNMPVCIKQGASPHGQWKFPGTNSTVSSVGCYYCSLYMCASYYVGHEIPVSGGMVSFQDALNKSVSLNGDSVSDCGAALFNYYQVPAGNVHNNVVDKITLEQLKAEIDAGRPIIYRVDKFAPIVHASKKYHFTVIMGYDDTKQCIYVYDSGKQAYPVPREVPYADWIKAVNEGHTQFRLNS